MTAEKSSPPELSTRYEPHSTESRWYSEWETRGYFQADVNAPGDPYSMVIPPPNITGILHMGHALNNTIQDILARWKRMDGFNTLWVPGTDHASIATQYVVEKKLRDEGIERPRETLGRDKFLGKIWEWKEKHGGLIVEQLKRMGCSCDWSRERFTMDEGLSRAVRKVFSELYREGLIYKGNYLINWCPRCLTTLADDEVEHEEKNGKLWYLRYPIEGQPGRFAVVATTRPETMLGDSAIAVNPKDARYTNLIGRNAMLPLLNRPIPIIADDFVDREFGTGMVKITPAHDPNDYQAGKRHNLPEINVLTPDAHINENGGQYAGLDRYAARKKIVADLEELGLLEKVEEHPQRVGTCYRCHTVIEPYISLQWFVKMEPLATPCRQAVETNQVQFHPEARKADLFNWLDNLRDWCISRQLWWGHQIPAFYRADGSIVVSNSEEEYQALRAEVADGKTGLRQDEDVLDTWFSSALWPFSTLGWPDENAPDLSRYYPTATLSTGRDIIFLWVARMIMMGIHFMHEPPFKDVFFHPIVADEHGKKMSKSKGNALNPLDLIADYGTDALRITLASYAAREQHIAFNPKELEGYRNFMNKIWNASRLAISNFANIHHQDIEKAGPLSSTARTAFPLEDRWILHRYTAMVARYNAALESFDFDVAVKSFREFFWNDLCDYYLEIVKPRLYVDLHALSVTPAEIHSRTMAQALLFTLLEGSLRLLHPICPFISEEIWQTLRSLRGDGFGFNSPSAEMSSHVAPAFLSPTPQAIIEGVVNSEANGHNTLGHRTLEALDAPSIMLAPWIGEELSSLSDEEAERQTGILFETLYAIRNIRGEMRIQPGMAANVLLVIPDDDDRAIVEAQPYFITILTKVNTLHIKKEATPPAFAATAVAGAVTVYVELPAEMRQEESKRLEKEIGKLQEEATRLQAKLSNESFISRAPAEVVAKEKERLAALNTDMIHLKEKQEQLK